MTIECTPLDHSDYKKATNFWGLERTTSGIYACAKCGRPSFDEWFRKLDWHSTNSRYWKHIFREAKEQQAFFFKAVVPKVGSWQYTIYVDADVNDPASLLRPTQPEWLIKTYSGDISAAIKQRRYLERLPSPKEHDYGPYQPELDRQLKLMQDGLDYVDNERFAALDSRKDMRRYNEQKDRGCCGSKDEVVTIYGRKFTIGCNHGH